jgi:uncharacterized protein (DUF2252 family)
MGASVAVNVSAKSKDSVSEAAQSPKIDLSELFVPGSGLCRIREQDADWLLRHRVGKMLRERTPREAHAAYTASRDRPNPLSLLAASNKGRRSDLIPLRMGRMAVSPFTFLRGAACVMAWDLSKSPNSGIRTVIDGDAHINNFGLFGSAQKTLVADLNDFDEATIGPWEWDLKRLVASVNVAARDNGFNKANRKEAVLRAAEGYHWSMARLETKGVLDIWYMNAVPGKNEMFKKNDASSAAILTKAAAKALQQNNSTLLNKIAVKGKNGWRFRENPPILTRVDANVREKVIAGLEEYWRELPAHRAFMFNRYHVVDICHRVGGVGSVGLRSYLALLMGNDENDPLFLQVKECVSPAHAPYVAPLPPPFDTHHGKRVVMGQRTLQSDGDPMLGPTLVAGQSYFVRQLKNMKGGLDVVGITGEPFYRYVQVCGALLARAHSRGGDAAAIHGYIGKSAVLDEALAEWAEAYAEQTIADHALLVESIKSGKTRTIHDV